MDILSNFKEKNFAVQIQLLNEIAEKKNYKAIGELFELFINPLQDNCLDPMIEETLRELLQNKEESTIKGLSSNNLRLKRLCIQVAGEKHFLSAVPFLVSCLEDKNNQELLFDLLLSLSKIKSPEFLEIFKRYVQDEDPIIATLSIEMIGFYRDASSLDLLYKIVKEAETEEQYKVCSIVTYKVIEALGNIENKDALAFLVSNLHHRNPCARRIIFEELFKKGAGVIPLIAPVFEQGDVDLKIMAANLLGLIGDRRGSDILIDAIEKGKISDPNGKYAVYEALGAIPSIKGITYLLEGLTIEDDLILMVIIFSLNAHMNSDISGGILTGLKELIELNTPQSDKILQAVISSTALSLFEGLYKDKKTSKRLFRVLLRSGDKDVILEFCKKLDSIGEKETRVNLEKLLNKTTLSNEKKILVVDDSKTMLFFYRSAASTLGFYITTATNGKEALNFCEQRKAFDLIITDLNMPVMDGIEFVRSIRKDSFFRDIPIIMATTESEFFQKKIAVDAGVNYFLSKPFTMEELQKKIKEVIGMMK
ncbi:MAG: response regulator [bacterium]